MKKASDEVASRSAVEGCLGLRYINRKSRTKEQKTGKLASKNCGIFLKGAMYTYIMRVQEKNKVQNKRNS